MVHGKSLRTDQTLTFAFTIAGGRTSITARVDEWAVRQTVSPPLRLLPRPIQQNPAHPFTRNALAIHTSRAPNVRRSQLLPIPFVDLLDLPVRGDAAYFAVWPVNASNRHESSL